MDFFMRVFLNKTSGQKLITIPVKENIKPGDWVRVSKADQNPASDYPKPPSKRKGKKRKNKK